jgi:catalase
VSIQPRLMEVVSYCTLAMVSLLCFEMSLSEARAQDVSAARSDSAHADPEAIVNALKAVAGNPSKVRASFSKGHCVRGSYTPSQAAAQVTKSPSFTKPSPVLGRFAVGGGNPKVMDTNKLVLRGFSFKLGGDSDTSDILVESAPVHFAKSLDQMLAFLQARIPGPDGKPDPEKVKAFSAANPETLNQAKFVAGKPLPGSFAGITYWGVHSFPATNDKGETRFIKFKVVPLGGEITLSDDEAKEKPADFLAQDLERRISEGNVRFDVLALLDRPGDPTMDVTVRWPDEDAREAVRLGTIAITAIEKNAPCDESIFNPGNLADGIGFPPDEMFSARRTAYAISLAKRRD